MKKRFMILMMMGMMLLTVSCGKKEDEVVAAKENIENIENATDTEKEDKEKEDTIKSEDNMFDEFTGYTTGNVNIRKEPSSDAESYGIINYNTKVTVIGENEDWYIVKLKTGNGYIAKSFISTEKMPEKEEDTSEPVVNNKESEEIQTEDVKEDVTEEKPEEIKNESNEENQPAESTEINANANTKSEAGNIIAGDAYQSSVLAEINAYRNANGIASLALTDKLCQSASTRAVELYSVHEHTRPDGTRWNTSLTFSPLSAISENAGCTTGTSIVELWKASASHNAALLDSKYTVCGIGYYDGPDGGKYVALHLY